MEGEEIVTLHSVQITPQTSSLQAEVGLVFQFTPVQAVSGAFWEISYIVDTFKQRYNINVLTTAPIDYEQGTQANLEVTLPPIDLSQFKKRQLLNAGLLLCVLKTDAAEILAVNLITQVADGPDGLTKTIVSPL